MEELIAEYGCAPDYRYLLARCYRELAAAQRWHGGIPDSIPDAEKRATEILEELVKVSPDVPDYRNELSQTYAMAVMPKPFSREKIDPAAVDSILSTMKQAIAISEELVAEHPHVPEYAFSQVFIRKGLALFLERTQKFKEAEDQFGKAIALQSLLAKHFPRNSFFSLHNADLHQLLAWMLEHDRLAEARDHWQACISLREKVLQSDPVRYAWLRAPLTGDSFSLARVLQRLGDKNGAAEAERKAKEYGGRGDMHGHGPFAKPADH